MWKDLARCNGTDPETFFDELRVGEAKALCADCSVIPECLAFAVSTNQEGVWGNTTNQERRQTGRLIEIGYGQASISYLLRD